jgi:hypothetical protein
MPGPNVPGVASKKLKAPSEMLLLQPNGELVIRDMASDAEEYARLKNETDDLQNRTSTETKNPAAEPGTTLKNPGKVNIFELGPKKK